MPVPPPIHRRPIAPERVRKVRLGLYGAFAALLALAGVFALFGQRSLMVAALGMIFTSAPVAMICVAWMKSKSTQHGDWDLHPRRGVLVEVPKTWAGLLGRLALYSPLVAVAALAVHSGLPGGSEIAVADAMMGAAFLQFLFVCVVGELLAFPVVRRWGTTPPRRIALGLVAAVTVVVGVLGTSLGLYLVAYLSEVRDMGSPIERTLWATPVTLLLYGASAWFRAVFVAGWQRKLDDQARATQEAERGRKLAEAQLAMLQAQIEPHFLYNTLASVQYLVRRDPEGADFLLTQLIRYLRHAMPKMRQSMSTLGQEFELADAFLQIARIRMGGRLTIDVELASELSSIPFPPLVLQTLVENALKHGVEPKVGPVSITVRARHSHSVSDGNTVCVEVIDNGVGLGGAKTAGSGSGLANIRERLAGIYGEHASLTVSNLGTGGVSSRLDLAFPASESVPSARADARPLPTALVA